MKPTRRAFLASLVAVPLAGAAALRPNQPVSSLVFHRDAFALTIGDDFFRDDDYTNAISAAVERLANEIDHAAAERAYADFGRRALGIDAWTI